MLESATAVRQLERAPYPLDLTGAVVPVAVSHVDDGSRQVTTCIARTLNAAGHWHAVQI